MLSAMVEELRSKNADLLEEINQVKINEAAARRKCGKLFLKALSMSAKDGFSSEQANLYDDDSIISLYDLLASKLPNL